MSRLVRVDPGLAATGIAGVALLAALPAVLDLYSLLQLTLYVVFGILALSLAFIWGYAGILCFGHAAFFGLGAYAYAVSVINLGDSTAAVVIAMALPAAFAAALGYFMFYGRISDVYVGVITLTVTLILYNVVNATSGPRYHIGEALLGGFNGMPNVPPLNMPFQPDDPLDPTAMFELCGVILLAVYFGLHALLRTRFGRVLVAVRENEQRVEYLGYDARLHKLIAFALAGAIAGLAGCLFTAWGNFVSPTVFSVVQSAQIIIWLMVGGVGTLLGPVIGAMAISWLTLQIGTQQTVNANVVLGAVLLVFVLMVPKGLLPMLTGRMVPWLISRGRKKPAAPQPAVREAGA